MLQGLGKFLVPDHMPKKKHLLPAILVACGIASNAIAQTTGKLTCATWVAERSQGGSHALQVQTWLDGYLSGLADGSADDVANASGQASNYQWMDNYCRDHPQDNAKDAGEFLINEQLKKKHPYRHQY